MIAFSIILPVRNGGEHLKECIQSILSQTHTLFTLHLLDNCSSDGSVEWVRSLNDPRIQVQRSDRTLSIEESWGRGLAVNKQPYMTLIGHDDVWQPAFLETMNGLIQQHPDASLFHSHFRFIDDKGNIIRFCRPMPALLDKSGLYKMFLEGTIDMTGTGYVFRSQDYDALHGLKVSYPGLLFADFELWLRLASQSYMVIDPADLFAFRVHQSATTTARDKMIQDGLYQFVNFMGAQAETDESIGQLVREQGPRFLMRYVRSYAHRLLRTPPGKRKGLTVASLINRSKEMAERLQVGGDFHPDKDRSLLMSKAIDQNILLGGLFRLARKIHPGPFTR